MEAIEPIKRSEKEKLIDAYRNGAYEDIEFTEVPDSIKERLERRVFQYSLEPEAKTKPVNWFKVVLENGDVIYGGQFNEEHGDYKDFGADDKPIYTKIDYAPAFYFFETNHEEAYVGRGGVRFLPGNDEMPIVDYVESEERNTGRGTARYYLMNTLSKQFFNKPLYSSTWTDPKNAPQKIWRRFYENGEAEIVETHDTQDEDGNEETIYRYRFL